MNLAPTHVLLMLVGATLWFGGAAPTAEACAVVVNGSCGPGCTGPVGVDCGAHRCGVVVSGVCRETGSCGVNFGDCAGQCGINFVFCEQGGTCDVNFGHCAGRCNVSLARCEPWEVCLLDSTVCILGERP